MKFDSLAPPTGPDRPSEQSLQVDPAAGAPAELPAVAEWRKAHAALMAQEHAFSQLVTRRAHGQASLEELELARRELQAMRDLADIVAQKALGLPSAGGAA